jgi:unsaturated rhamnogalacturonyl hydrolase
MLIEVKACPEPQGTATLNGVPQLLRWTKGSPRKRWSAWVNALPSASTQLRMRLDCGTGPESVVSAFAVRSDDRTALREMGTRVAKHYMALKPATKLPWDWTDAVFLYGLAQFAATPSVPPSEVADLWRYINGFHRHYAAKGYPDIDRADRCPSALSALALMAQSGDEAGLAGVRAVADYVLYAPRLRNGALNHQGYDNILAFLWPQSIWLDSLMMYGLFAVQWGTQTHDLALRDFGFDQQRIFAQALLDSSTGLYRHSYNVKTGRKKPNGSVYWLRGNAWVAASLVDMIELMPFDHPWREELTGILRTHLAGYIPWRMGNGLWDTLITEPRRNYAELSGSMLTAYAMAKAARLGLVEPLYRARAWETMRSASSRLIRTEDGHSVPEVSWFTMPYHYLGYKLIPRQRDLAYGVGTYLMLAGELSRSDVR